MCMRHMCKKPTQQAHRRQPSAPLTATIPRSTRRAASRSCRAAPPPPPAAPPPPASSRSARPSACCCMRSRPTVKWISALEVCV